MVVKRRQGQGGATPKEICPKCGEYLQKCYKRVSANGKQMFKDVGLICPSHTCDYIIKDFVQLEDTEE